MTERHEFAAGDNGRCGKCGHPSKHEIHFSEAEIARARYRQGVVQTVVRHTDEKILRPLQAILALVLEQVRKQPCRCKLAVHEFGTAHDLCLRCQILAHPPGPE